MVARDYVPGRALAKREPMDAAFFQALSDLLDRIHERGVAYIDLEKPDNILVGDDGRPHLIDFGVAFYVPRRLLGEMFPVRALRRLLQRSDRYHFLKHYRRSCAHLMTPEEKARSRRKPWPVQVGNVLFAPWKSLRRRVLGK